MIEENRGIRRLVDQSFTQEKISTTAILKKCRMIGIPELVAEQFLNDVLSDFCKRTWILQKTIEIGDEVEVTPDPDDPDDPDDPAGEVTLYTNSFLNDPEGQYSPSNTDTLASGFTAATMTSTNSGIAPGVITSDGFTSGAAYSGLKFSGVSYSKPIQMNGAFTFSGNGGSAIFGYRLDLSASGYTGFGFEKSSDGLYLTPFDTRIIEGDISSYVGKVISFTSSMTGSQITISVFLEGSEIYSGVIEPYLLDFTTPGVLISENCAVRELEIIGEVAGTEPEPSETVLYQNDFTNDPIGTFNFSNADTVDPSLNHTIVDNPGTITANGLEVTGLSMFGLGMYPLNSDITVEFEHLHTDSNSDVAVGFNASSSFSDARGISIRNGSNNLELATIKTTFTPVTLVSSPESNWLNKLLKTSIVIAGNAATINISLENNSVYSDSITLDSTTGDRFFFTLCNITLKNFKITEGS